MSDKINDGGQAFPSIEQGGGKKTWHLYPGMSLRDWFAGQALAAIAVNVIASSDRDYFGKNIVTQCYKYADAMLKAREEVAK